MTDKSIKLVKVRMDQGRKGRTGRETSGETGEQRNMERWRETRREEGKTNGKADGKMIEGEQQLKGERRRAKQKEEGCQCPEVIPFSSTNLVGSLREMWDTSSSLVEQADDAWKDRKYRRGRLNF